MSDQNATQEEITSRSSNTLPRADSATGQSVIVLHDLTSGPEAELSRLKSRLVELTAEIVSLRRENQKLNTEMREMKLVLSKVQLSELRGLEKINFWLRSLKMVL